MHTRRSPLPVLLVAVAVLAGACGGGGAGGAEVAVDDGAVPAATPTVGGGELSWASLEGTDTVLWFWAPWCTVCRAESDDVVAAAEAFDGQVQVVGVASRGDVPEMEGFVADTGTGGLTHVADADGAIWSAYGVTTQPAFAFIDDGGTMELYVGALGEDGLTERMQALAAS